MAIVHKRDTNEVLNKLNDVARQYGLTRTDRFIGAFIDYFANIYGESINNNYDLDDQTRIDTATGEYLDGYGQFLEQTRQVDYIANDLSLDNASIITSNSLPVSNYTLGGEPIYIPSGTSILDSSGIEVMTTIDDVVTDANRAFIRVQGVYGVDLVNPGVYTLDGGIDDFSLSNDNDLDMETTDVVLPLLQVNLQVGLDSNTTNMDDETYRSVLFSKTESINQLNKQRINTLLGNENIARFVIKEFSSGSSSISIYVEPVLGILSKPMELLIKKMVHILIPYATVVHIARMVPSLVQVECDITIADSVPSGDVSALVLEVKNVLIDNIRNLQSGDIMTISDILPNVTSVTNLTTIVSKEIYIHGDKILKNTYTMRDIEYLYAVENSITINVI